MRVESLKKLKNATNPTELERNSHNPQLALRSKSRIVFEEKMRIDQLLNKLCLVKTRSIAKKACDKDLVKINDKIAKSSSNVNAGDIIEYQLYGFQSKFRILEIPLGNVSKNNAAGFYEMLGRKKLEVFF